MGKIMKEGKQYGVGGTQKADEITYGTGTVEDALNNLNTSLNNKGRAYTTEPLTTFFNNVKTDEFEIFSASADMTSKLTNSGYSGLSYGFAVYHPSNSLVEALFFATGSGYIYTCRITSTGGLEYTRRVALTAF